METNLYYDLDGNPCDMYTWADLFDDFDGRVIGRTTVGHYTVSTVWLGIDHGLGTESKPVLWESMIFINAEDGTSDPHDLSGTTVRYSSRDDAFKGHQELVKKVLGMEEGHQ